MERRTQERLRELANGAWEDMDPQIRRCMVVLCDELDKIHDTNRSTRKLMADTSAQVRGELSETRKVVIGLMVAIIVAVVGSGVANAIWR